MTSDKARENRGAVPKRSQASDSLGLGQRAASGKVTLSARIAAVERYSLIGGAERAALQRSARKVESESVGSVNASAVPQRAKASNRNAIRYVPQSPPSTFEDAAHTTGGRKPAGDKSRGGIPQAPAAATISRPYSLLTHASRFSLTGASTPARRCLKTKQTRGEFGRAEAPTRTSGRANP